MSLQTTRVRGCS